MLDFQFAALQGLFHELLLQFPNLKSVLPDWWDKEEIPPAALQWATNLAAQGQKSSPLLKEQRQRVSIFTRVFQPETKSEKRYVPLALLETNQLMPQEQQHDPAAAYQTLLDSLETALTACKSLSPGEYLVSAADILQRHTWCLPSPYDPQPDEPALSLYDHSRIVAALTPCYRENGSETGPIATLISGDISGIQDFIYTITARGAVSGLRGRSFYLQLLTDAIATYVLKALGDLPATSIIYAGGGHFYILAPGDQGQKVEALRAQITEKLWRHHRDLYVGLGYTTVEEADLAPDTFAETWQQVGHSVSQAKNRRFSELGDDMFARLFRPDRHGRGGDKDTECRVCHYEGNDPEKEFMVDENRLDDEGDPIRKCLMCDSLEKLGNDLRHAHFIMKQRIPEKTADNRTTWQAALAEFGVTIKLYPGDELDKIPIDKPNAELWALNDAASQQVVPFYGRLPIRLQYLVNETPVVTKKDRDEFIADQKHDWAWKDLTVERLNDNRLEFVEQPETEEEKFRQKDLIGEVPIIGAVKSFTLLQAQAEGIKRLGILRMDVDDLGKIFQQGLGEKNGLVQTTALSTAVSLYFEAWVAYLIQTIDLNKRDVIYSIYSGGDDLFIVGAWDLLPELGWSIASDLQRYAAGNPRIHASAGITLHSGKFPLYQAASAAEDALEAAKAYDGKNAFTFLNRTYSWDAYDEISTDQAQLLYLIAHKDVGRSLLQHILWLDEMYQAFVTANTKKGIPDPDVYWGRGPWLHVYQMTRMASRINGLEREIVQNEIFYFRDKLRHDNFKHIRVVGLSARWAELSSTRKISNAPLDPQYIQITLDTQQFTKYDKARLIEEISKRLNIDLNDLEVLGVDPGSRIITLEMPDEETVIRFKEFLEQSVFTSYKIKEVESVQGSHVIKVDNLKIDLARLRSFVVDCFDQAELEDLCFDLNVDYQNLRGESKSEKAREAIGYLKRRGRIDQLLTILEKSRPQLYSVELISD